MDNFENDITKDSDERRPRRFPILVWGLIGGIIGSFLTTAIFPTYYRRPIEGGNERVPLQGQRIVLNPRDDVTIASAVAAKVTPTVVRISATTAVRDALGRERRSEGVGSGVIVSSNGYILTNSHVVGFNPVELTIHFEGGEVHDAVVLWQDPVLDLAVVKVNLEGLPVADLGDSDNIIVGETAIAIGNPLGLRFERTVTQGIISGLNRSVILSRTEIMEDLIQTDAAINPGNSGGPLINSRGEVIGINTVKATAEGLGFAIPINITKPIVRKFMETGTFVPTYLGVSILDKEVVGFFMSPDVQLERGILISAVLRGAGAAEAGLQRGDVITHVDGIEVNTMLKFKTVLFERNPGDRVTLRYIRNNRELTTEAVLRAQPEA